MLTDDTRKKGLNVSPRAKQCPLGMDLAALGKKWIFHTLRSIGISHIDRWCRAYLRLQRPRNCRSEGGYPNAFRREWRVRNPRAAQARSKYSSVRDAAYPQGRCQYRRIIISDPTGRTIGASILIQDISEKKLRRLSSKGQG